LVESRVPIVCRSSRWDEPVRRRDALLAALVLVLSALAVGFLAGRASAATEYQVTSETMARGSTTGFGNEGQDDGVTDVKTEAGTSQFASQTLMPNADFVDDGWNQAPCSVDTSEWDELDETPHDGDATCRRTTATTTSVYVFTNMEDVGALPSGILDDLDVTAYVTVRRESGDATTGTTCSGPVCGEQNYNSDQTPCTIVQFGDTSSASYVEGSVFRETCGGGTEWTATRINAVTVASGCEDGDGAASEVCRTTQHRLLVGITYRDTFYVDFISEFGGVASDASNLRLQYQCTSTDAETTLQATHLGAAVGTIDCDGVTHELALNGDSGVVSVELASISTTDITASTYTFDVLILLADTTGGGGGGGGDEDVFELACFPRIASIDCFVRIRDPVPPGVWLISSYWTSPGEVRRVQANATRHDVSLPFFQLTAVNVTITVSVVVSDGGTARLTTVVPFDDSWIVIALLTGTVLAVVVYFWRHAKKAEAKAAAAKKERNQYQDQYTKHRRIMFGR